MPCGFSLTHTQIKKILHLAQEMPTPLCWFFFFSLCFLIVSFFLFRLFFFFSFSPARIFTGERFCSDHVDNPWPKRAAEGQNSRPAPTCRTTAPLWGSAPHTAAHPPAAQPGAARWLGANLRRGGTWCSVTPNAGHGLPAAVEH